MALVRLSGWSTIARSLMLAFAFAFAAGACADSTTSPTVSDARGIPVATAPSDTTLPASATPPASTPMPATPNGNVSVFAGARLYVDPSSSARKTADSWRSSRPGDAAQLDKIAAQPAARWFGNWNTNITGDVDAAITSMTAAGALPVIVAYNIPQRDCGGLSGGNDVSVTQYRSWIDGFGPASGGPSTRSVLPNAPAAPPDPTTFCSGADVRPRPAATAVTLR